MKFGSSLPRTIEKHLSLGCRLRFNGDMMAEQNYVGNRVRASIIPACINLAEHL